MDCKGFVMAMRARVAQLSIDQMHQPTNAVIPDWLIVSRWGEASQYLTISSAMGELAAADGAESRDAPLGLHPRRTWFGVLTPDREGAGSLFLFNRALPEDVPIAGDFAPAEGYARLIAAEDGGFRLVAVARELAEARPLAPEQKLTASPAAWHLVAERRPWQGEVLDCPRD
jgi:hypothetical protein